AAANPLRLQLLMHAGTAVAPLAGPVDRADLHSESLIRPLSLLGASPLRRIETGTQDPKHPADHQDLELASMCLNAGVLQRDSLAKYAAAFFRKAFSCLAYSSSRRKRRSSCSWLVSFPLPAKTSPPVSPSRLSACRFQVRSMSGRIP